MKHEANDPARLVDMDESANSALTIACKTLGNLTYIEEDSNTNFLREVSDIKNCDHLKIPIYAIGLSQDRLIQQLLVIAHRLP